MILTCPVCKNDWNGPGPVFGWDEGVCGLCMGQQAGAGEPQSGPPPEAPHVASGDAAPVVPMKENQA